MFSDWLGVRLLSPTCSADFWAKPISMSRSLRGKPDTGASIARERIF
jgi:hypothetical protein